jgi:6-pyruvoyltetrahydropterin/6-carboxytetrahydropterin synthase
MRTVDLTRLYRFNAGHRLFHPDKSDDWNWRIFGKCSYESGHGHNYGLEVVLRGTPDPETGMVMPIDQLDAIIEEHVIEPIDHRNLNDVLELHDGPAPTTEVLILDLWRRLDGKIPPPARLWKLRVTETEKNSFEIQASVD